MSLMAHRIGLGRTDSLEPAQSRERGAYEQVDH
jgi:hypothetical protein